MTRSTYPPGGPSAPFFNVIPNGTFEDSLSGFAPNTAFTGALLGWVAGPNTTATRVLVDDGSGANQPVCQLKATAAGDVSVETASDTAKLALAFADRRHTWTGLKMSPTVARAWKLRLRWYTAAAALISAWEVTVAAGAVGAWQETWTSMVAPSNAARLVFGATVVGCAANEVHCLDELGVFVGNGDDTSPYPYAQTYYDQNTPGVRRQGYFSVAGPGASQQGVPVWGCPEAEPS